MNTILPKIKSKSTSTDHSHQVKQLIDTLATSHTLSKEDYLFLLEHITITDTTYLFQKAYEAKQPYYQNRVYLRGLIELSNYCIQGCHYCGINRSNQKVERYRLTVQEILECISDGYQLGYRTFVLQGGEDPYFTDQVLIDIVSTVKRLYQDIRITLSMGERSFASYQALREAGVDRYLLRHETASRRLYETLHPDTMSFDNRIQCLYNLRQLGYQVGAGFMVGSPTQTNQDLVEDLVFLQDLDPHMVGIGPYLCHSETVLKGNDSGTLMETFVLVALVRLLLPKALIPATTALGTLDHVGREKALYVGANVMMPNISPTSTREQYEIYQNKICTGDTSTQCRGCIEMRINAYQHTVDLGVGDYVGYHEEQTI